MFPNKKISPPHYLKLIPHHSTSQPHTLKLLIEYTKESMTPDSHGDMPSPNVIPKRDGQASPKILVKAIY